MTPAGPAMTAVLIGFYYQLSNLIWVFALLLHGNRPILDCSGCVGRTFKEGVWISARLGALILGPTFAQPSKDEQYSLARWCS